ncbi:MAG TPA: hypothetical protein VM487_10705, partial [Phycisphaerae bacterium]|nr:hypothetical protein [Phycisphaerae bacterium]
SPMMRIGMSNTFSWAMRMALSFCTILNMLSLLSVWCPVMLLAAKAFDRCEPRAKKRRPKEYDLMNEPRDVLRSRLLCEA